MKMSEEQKRDTIEALDKIKKLVEEDKVTAIASAVLLDNETKTFLMGSAVKLYGLVGTMNQDIVKESIEHENSKGLRDMLDMLATRDNSETND